MVDDATVQKIIGDYVEHLSKAYGSWNHDHHRGMSRFSPAKQAITFILRADC